jgi:hypothetical protein
VRLYVAKEVLNHTATNLLTLQVVTKIIALCKMERIVQISVSNIYHDLTCPWKHCATAEMFLVCSEAALQGMHKSYGWRNIEFA